MEITFSNIFQSYISTCVGVISSVTDIEQVLFCLCWCCLLDFPEQENLIPSSLASDITQVGLMEGLLLLSIYFCLIHNFHFCVGFIDSAHIFFWDLLAEKKRKKYTKVAMGFTTKMVVIFIYIGIKYAFVNQFKVSQSFWTKPTCQQEIDLISRLHCETSPYELIMIFWNACIVYFHKVS